MAQSTFWWLLAGAAAIVELVTGTFYLLMLAVGLAAGAIASHAGASTTGQIVVAALVGAGLVLAWRAYRLKTPVGLPASANPDVNPDIGASVHVDAWRADGTATVKYRGAQWSVALAPGAEPVAGTHQIVEVIGSRLIVRPAPSHP